MTSLTDPLVSASLPYLEASFTALDAFHGVKPAPLGFILVLGGIIDLAKASDGLSYPGLSYADAVLGSLGMGTEEARPLYVRLADSLEAQQKQAFLPLELLRRPGERASFRGPEGIYSALRKPVLEPLWASDEDLLFQAAILVSRYDYALPEGFRPSIPRDFPLQAQKDLLILILTGKRPESGLSFLKSIGFLDAYWPELKALEGVDQAKEFHPEGDVWAHTMETFRYRKIPDLRLSLGLLLHDSGKPEAGSVPGRKFDRHAEIGSSLARRFLSRLGFSPSIGADVSFLVRYHMLPAALPRLPLEKGIEGVDDPLFPLLLELYKCDELSSFKGPEGYYAACAAYRAHLKNTRNPWRNPEALRLARIYLSSH